MIEVSGSPQEEIEIAHTAAIIEAELRDGFLVNIAAARVDDLPEGLTPSEVAEIILPEPKGNEPLEPRWTLVDEAETAKCTKAAIADNGERIITAAEALALRKLVYGERQPEATHEIDREKAIFIVEGGANKTSIVRRGVAIKAMQELYGDDLSSQTLYQLGGGRVISPTREVLKPDGTKETVVNAEHKTIRGLAGSFLPAGSFTEFEANFATALAEGYKILNDHDVSDDGLVSCKIELKHSDISYPRLILIQPAGKGLEAGFDALKPVTDGRQVVIATNGQYREKDKHQAELWAQANQVEMLPAVALGDEPGDIFIFGNKEIVVPNRPAAAYTNELIILWRLAMKRLPNIKPGRQE